MKKTLSLLLAFFLVFPLCTNAIAIDQPLTLTDDEKLQIQLQNSLLLFIDNPDAYFYGDFKSIDSNWRIRPFIENGRTLIPLRFVAECFDATVSYSSPLITIKKGSLTIEFTLNSNIIKVNGQSSTMEIAPKILNDRTYVPLRALVESLGENVIYYNGLIVISDEKINTLNNKLLTDYVYLMNPNETNMKAKVKEIVSEIITPDMTELDKIVAIHTYVVTHFEFFNGWVAGFGSIEGDTSAICTNKANVLDYANAINMLCLEANIECHFIEGNHNVWNIVKINGQYYHIDALMNRKEYNFFLVSDETMKNAGYSWTSKYKCTSKDYEYITEDIEEIEYTHVRNNNIVAYKDKCLYFFTMDSLKKYNIYTRHCDNILTIDISNSTFFDAVFDNGWIYFSTKNGIERIKIDGSSRQVISSEETCAADLILKNGYLFYRNYNSPSNLYRVKIDGSEIILVSDEIEQLDAIRGNWIYYERGWSDGYYNGIYRVKVDGTLKSKFVDKDHICFINLDKSGEIEYTDASGKSNFIRIK